MPKTSTEAKATRSNRSQRYQKAAALLRKWMAEENGYDEKTWPVLERELRDSALRCRETDDAPI